MSEANAEVCALGILRDFGDPPKETQPSTFIQDRWILMRTMLQSNKAGPWQTLARRYHCSRLSETAAREIRTILVPRRPRA